MRRILVLGLVGLLGFALFGGLVHVVLVAARVADPAATTVVGLTPSRVWATTVTGMAFVGVVAGALSLARVGRFAELGLGRLGSIVALAAGLVAVVGGSWILAGATGGPGSGNGVVGAAMALVLGVIAAALGGLALARAGRAVASH